MAFTISDGLLIAATLLGPVAAIQVQKFLERTQTERDRRVRIFKTLMATRAARLSPNHIEALNMINIEFPSAKRFKKVRNAWKAYFAHLAETVPEDPQAKAIYFARRPDLLTDLLYEMGTALGFDFDKTQISKEIYFTIFHENLENDLQTIRTKLVELLTGKTAIPMNVVSIPGDPEAAANQAEYFKYLAQQVREGKPLRVEIVAEGTPSGGKVISMPPVSPKDHDPKVGATGASA